VTGLQWSADSELLALSVDSGEEGGGVALQVWRRGNWHWDLKHEMRFPFAQVSHPLSLIILFYSL
jgi:hypothetical protein